MVDIPLLGKKKDKAKTKEEEDIKLSKGDVKEIVDFMDAVKTSISDMNKRMDALGVTKGGSISDLDCARALGYREAMKDMMRIRGEK